MAGRLSSKKRKLLKVIQFTFLLYVSYLVVFLYDYFSCNSEVSSCFYQTDLNVALALVAGICYVVNIAAQVQTFFIDEKKHRVFLYYRILAGVLTIVVIMTLIVTMISSGGQTNEFMNATPSE